MLSMDRVIPTTCNNFIKQYISSNHIKFLGEIYKAQNKVFIQYRFSLLKSIYNE